MAQQEDYSEITGKPFLLGLFGTLAGRKFHINGPRALLGRDASECNIVLAQAVISKRHAVFEIDSRGSVTIIDLNSRQGTFVNGEAVTRRELRDGDRVGFGPGGVIAFTYHSASHSANSTPAGMEPVLSPSASAERGIPPSLLATNIGFHVTDESDTPGSPTTTLRIAHLPMLRLGRAPDNEIILDAPSVSRHHAVLTYGENPQPVIADLGSTNGTFVNGEPLEEPRLVNQHDLIFIGGFLLQVDGHSIKTHDLSASRITARNIRKEIQHKTILNDISLAIYPREFVGLMGPSGCGKSTLMDALNGLRPASSGSVLINDLDLYHNFDALRRSIGYVPQRDILHDALTVERTLYYAAKLRLPESTQPDALRRILDEVIETVGLGKQRTTEFRQLSGGQQKRLSLALELITKPSFIFLDEPTSPLDPVTTENMMMLFRRLADEGRIVVMVTHKFEKFKVMHQIALLTQGGHLAFFGPPQEALTYFGCKEPGEIYRRIGAREPAELSRSFQRSPQYERYIKARLSETEELTRATTGPLTVGQANEQGVERRFGLSQWLTLTRRYLEVKLKDKRNTLLLLAQAPVVALILAMITGNVLNDAKTLFIAAIISIWFGANNAVREIVSENPIYTRERLVNLKIPSYVFSKFTVLSGIGLIQCVLFVTILTGFSRLGVRDFLPVTLILYLTLLSGVAIGLFFSALVNSTEKAMSVLPLLLIPQLLLSGFLKPLDDVYVNLRTGKPASAEQYRQYKEKENEPPSVATASKQSPSALPTAVPDQIQKSFDGLGTARPASALMVARWSIEALTHEVSIRDEKARERLATLMTVAEYKHVLEGDSPTKITTAYRRRVWLDMGVIALFNLLFLALTIWALKRKDVL